MGLGKLVRGPARRVEKAARRSHKAERRAAAAHVQAAAAAAAERAQGRDCGACGACPGEPRCLWRTGVLADEHRPDLLGVIATQRILPRHTGPESVVFEPVITVVPVREGAAGGPEVKALVEGYFRQTHDVMFCEVGGQGLEILPRFSL